MGYELMIERLRERAGFPRVEDAELAFAVSLRALAKSIQESDKDLIFGDQPKEVVQALRGASFDHVRGVEELGRMISVEEKIDLGTAVEHLQIVCQLLTEAMSDDKKKLLRLHLPGEISRLFDVASRGDEVTRHPPRPAGSGWTLANGRPTSRRPISSTEPERTLAVGRPGSEHPVSEASDEHAQSGSVVSTSNPHGSRKLSSGSR